MYKEPVECNQEEPVRFKASVEKAVMVLHDGGFVHGDIRDVNTMVARNWDHLVSPENVKSVDFEVPSARELCRH